MKMLPMNKKLAGMQIFVQTLFSRSTLKLEKKCHAAKSLAFSHHFIFRRDKTPNPI